MRAAWLAALAAVPCALGANTSRAFLVASTPACEVAPGFRTDCVHPSTCDCHRECEAQHAFVGLSGSTLLCFNHSRTASSTLDDVVAAPVLVYGRTRVVQPGAHHMAVPEVVAEDAWCVVQPQGEERLSHPRDCGPAACSMNGWCRADAKPPSCQCFLGWQGDTCQAAAPYAPCINACSGRGECVEGVCACAPGHHGVDCSLPLLADAAQTGVRPRIYIYELPPAFNVWRETVAISRNPSYLLWERLLASPHRTTDSAAADFFFLPVAAMGSVSHGVPLLAAEYVAHNWPYWNASAGRDHIIIWPWDFGSCWVARHPLVAAAIHVGHYGLLDARRNEACVCELCGAPYVPGKDIVVPSTLEFSFMLRSPFGANAPAPPVARDLLLFFAGLGTGPQRQRLLQIDVAGRHDVHISSEHIFLDEYMLRARFCIGAPGAGYGTRAVLAVIMGCVPVLVGDDVEEPWADQVDWGNFSVRVREAHVPQLLQIVEAIPPTELARMQAGLACAWRFFSWSTLWGALGDEDGSSDAFELLMHTLRERAAYGVQRRKLAPCEAVPGGRKPPRPLCRAGACPNGLSDLWPHGGAWAKDG